MIQVRCAHTKMVALNQLRPYPKNPNKHPDQQVAMLAKIIEQVGWRHPIVVSKRSGFMVAGHARLEAAKMLGEKKAPVDEQEFDSEEQEKACLLADNKIAELAEMDTNLLKDILKDLDGKIDLDLTGFDMGEIEKLIVASTYPKDEKESGDELGEAEKSSESTPGESEGPPKAQPGTKSDLGATVICPHCGKEILL